MALMAMGLWGKAGPLQKMMQLAQCFRSDIGGILIEEGNKVIVDRALAPKHDDIVVAVVEGDYTLKRLYKHMGRVELRAENPAYSPIVFSDGSELLVWGVVVGVVRRYSSRG